MENDKNNENYVRKYFLENIPYFQLYISALYKQAVIDLSINIKKF